MQVSAIGAKDPQRNAILQRAYTYSPLGNITAKNTEHGNYAYGYDDLSRLTSAVNPTLPSEAYTYDPLGNRLTAAATTGPWSYNINNELLAYNDTGFAYDENGNLTSKTTSTQIREFTYSVDDRLVAVEDDGGRIFAEYYYDPFGRRLWKEVDGVRTYFVYCDEGLVGEYDASGVEQRTYGWAPHFQWSTDPLFLKIGSQYYWYQNDHQGTPQKLITSSGLVVWSATYDSFGNAQIDVEVITNNLRFPGQYFDAETGLHYNWNRYYDPETCRYLRTDPFGDGLNLYAYVFNNPLSLIDPLGLCAVRDLGYYLGTGFGEEAAMWYAERYNATGNPIYFAGGLFASLWTPETYAQTAITLATAPLAAARIAAAGTKSAAAAARAAMKEVVEEVIGVPLPTKPKFHSRSGGQILEGATWDKIAIAPKSALQFGSDGLVLGLNKGGSLQQWAKQFGGKTFGKFDVPRGSFDKQIRSAMDQAKSIRINLDDVDLSRISGKLSEFGEPLKGYTNYELHLIKHNSSYLNKTSFYKGGIEVASPF